MRCPPRVTSRVAGLSTRSSIWRIPGASAGPRRKQSPDTGEQFVDGEGFGEVVVRTGIKSLHALVHFRLRREDQHGGLNFFFAKAGEHFQSRQTGQHQIDHDEVVTAAQGHVEALRAVFTEIDGVAFLFQRSLDERAYLGFIFNDEYTHRENS